MEKYLETEIIDNIKYELFDVDNEDCPIRISDGGFTFEQYLIKVDDKPKYLIALYQDGEIWSEDEIWGTKIIDLESIVRDKDENDVYLGDEINLDYYVNERLKDMISIVRKEVFEENYIYGLVYDN